MVQNLVNFEKALKENYLPVWNNQLGIEPSPLLAKVKKVPLVSNKIVASAPIGLSGGFGYGEEGKATPAAGGVPFERFETYARDMYVNIAISQKAVKLTGTGGAMANALDTEVKGAYNTAKWNMGRSLFGNGTGVLTSIQALGTAGNTISVDDVKNVKEGLIIDIYETGGTEPVEAGRRIVAVDRVNKTITVSGDKKAYPAGFITVQNSYNREITGLGTIFDENVTHIYGLEKATHPFLAPVTHDAEGNVDDGRITKVLREAQNDKNSKIDMILCGDDAYDHYVQYLRSENTRIENSSLTITGGFKALKFAFGNREVAIVNESFVPATEMWGVDTGVCEFHMQDWSFAELQGGGIFNLMENQSVYRALLTNYGDFICKNPGGCVRIYNCCQ